jgi:hypothetical protein
MLMRTALSFCTLVKYCKKAFVPYCWTYFLARSDGFWHIVEVRDADFNAKLLPSI